MKSTAKTATVLLVDDEPNVTDALKRLLRQEPYEILTAISAAAAQELLERNHVDVVISDEQMPGMSGSVFLSGVRKQYPHTIRMVLSGQASLEAAVRAINEGEVYRFFLKPCNATDLVITIRQALSPAPRRSEPPPVTQVSKTGIDARAPRKRKSRHFTHPYRR